MLTTSVEMESQFLINPVSYKVMTTVMNLKVISILNMIKMVKSALGQPNKFAGKNFNYTQNIVIIMKLGT
jgi:hypothetical protein